MVCPVVDICGGCERSNTLETKAREIYRCFHISALGSRFHLYASPDSGYRARAEFRIYRESSNVDSTNALPNLYLSMSAKGKNSRIKIQNCPILLPALQSVLHALLPLLQHSSILSQKLYAIEVLGSRFGTLEHFPKNLPKPTTMTWLDSSLQGLCYVIEPDEWQCSDVAITLIYHKRLDSTYEQAARELLHELKALCKQRVCDIAVIARSKNQKLCFRDGTMDSSVQDCVTDVVQVCGKPYIYLRKEGQFCQPNAYMNACMLSFAKSMIQAHKRVDLLEMYGGDGNFSIALAECFNKVLVTEMVKTASAHIVRNALLNSITNITSVRLSGAETMSALRGEREFYRLRGIDLSSFKFSHILIDPPRSGIGDKAILTFIADFCYIIYISCNPETLLKDLQVLLQTHSIENFALFDQFPHTHHKECALILRKQA